MPVVKQRVCTAVLPCLLLVSVTASARAASVTPLSSSCLTDAWQFAVAISNDPNDRAACQTKVARAWLDAGEPERAVKYATEISDWRKLAVIADAAAWWAGRGQTNEAMRALLEARHLAPGVKDWPYDRVQMHIARVLALLGMKFDLDVLAGAYRENRDCAGAVQAARALEAVRRGAADEAVGYLEQISKLQHIDLMSARAAGFRELATSGKIPKDKSAQLLKIAWDSASEVPGWRKVDLQLDLVDALLEAKTTDAARTHLVKLTDGLINEPHPNHIRAVRLAEASLRWARLGDAKQVAGLGARARELMSASMELIERPALLARLAEANAACGEKDKSETLFREAFDVAAGLLNPRPRAMAGVEVALAQARAQVDAKEFAGRRNAMLEGLGVRGR